jgi:hypothetical protein
MKINLQLLFQILEVHENKRHIFFQAFLGFSNHLCFKENLVHMFLVNLHLTHQNVDLLFQLFDVSEITRTV